MCGLFPGVLVYLLLSPLYHIVRHITNLFAANKKQRFRLRPLQNVETLQATSLQIQTDRLARPMFFEWHIRAREQLARDLEQRWRMQQHIRV